MKALKRKKILVAGLVVWIAAALAASVLAFTNPDAAKALVSRQRERGLPPVWPR